jgi:hypothetical protein
MRVRIPSGAALYRRNNEATERAYSDGPTGHRRADREARESSRDKETNDMDVYCPRCAEPMDTDEFHDVYQDDVKLTYDQARALFRQVGCAALDGGRVPTCENTGSLRAQASEVLMEMCGDDLDGVASMLDDFEWAGMLD